MSVVRKTGLSRSMDKAVFGQKERKLGDDKDAVVPQEEKRLKRKLGELLKEKELAQQKGFWIFIEKAIEEGVMEYCGIGIDMSQLEEQSPVIVLKDGKWEKGLTEEFQALLKSQELKGVIDKVAQRVWLESTVV